MDVDYLLFDLLSPALIVGAALVGLFRWRQRPLGQRLLRTCGLALATLVVLIAVWGPLIITLADWPRVLIFLGARSDIIGTCMVAAIVIVSCSAATLAWRRSAARGTAVRSIAAIAALFLAASLSASASVLAIDAVDARQNHAAMFTRFWWETSYDFQAVATVDPALGKKMQQEAYATFREHGPSPGDLRKIYTDNIVPTVARATDDALVAVLDARTRWLEAGAAGGKNTCLHVLRTDVFGPLKVVMLGKAYGDAIGAAYRSGREHPGGAPSPSEDEIAGIEEEAAGLPANPLTPEERALIDDQEKFDASCATRAKWLRNIEALGPEKAAADTRYHLAHAP